MARRPFNDRLSKTTSFSFHPSKDVVADFRGGQISSDAGLLPFIELDRRLGWAGQLAALLHDDRRADKTEHDLLQLLRRRFFGLIAGYEDCNDHTRLRGDPILKAAAGNTSAPKRAVQLLKPIIKRLRKEWLGVEMGGLVHQAGSWHHGRRVLYKVEANAFRLVLSAVAYNLFRVFHGALAGTELATASIETIRSRLIKIGGRAPPVWT